LQIADQRLEIADVYNLRCTLTCPEIG